MIMMWRKEEERVVLFSHLLENSILSLLETPIPREWPLRPLMACLVKNDPLWQWRQERRGVESVYIERGRMREKVEGRRKRRVRREERIVSSSHLNINSGHI